MERARILVVHPLLRASGGGGSALAAFAIEALARRFAVDVLTRDPLDTGALDRMFGCRLAETPLTNLCFGPVNRALHASSPPPCERVRRALTAREISRHHAARRPALLVSTNEEVDFGPLGPGLLYINWPLTKRDPEDPPDVWYQHSPFVTRLYRRFAAMISPWDPGRVARNTTLANSEFAAAAVRRTYGVEPAIVYPPVAGGFPDVPWERRRAAFVCVGRLNIEEKRLLDVIEIVARVRQRGHDVGLDLVGTRASDGDLERLRAQQRRHGSWLALHVDPDRRTLVGLLSANRYGLHGNRGEHFGIAVAELLRAGTVPFAPAHGGCAEILGRDPRLIFGGVDEAVELICAVLTDPAREAALRAFAGERRDLFTVERFQDGLIAAVERALAG